MTSAEHRRARRRTVAAAAAPADGVLGRRELYRLGVTRWELRAEVDAGRYALLGRQSVQVGPGDAQRQVWRRALLEVGARGALAGLSALQAAGLTGLTEAAVHVAVPKSTRPRRAAGVVVHETRRFREAAVLRGPLSRFHPATAVVQAALWAVTDRQAALFLVAPLQQRLCAAEEVAVVLDEVVRHRRRRLLRAVLADVLGGAESLGELDLAALCRQHGLPEPDRQVVHRLPQGRVVLDAEWARYRVVVEVDGVQHGRAAALVADALRDNELRLTGRTVLRVPSLALRADPLPFLRQLARALRAGGWRGAA